MQYGNIPAIVIFLLFWYNKKMIITSKENKFVKEAMLLKTKKYRDDLSLFLVEGLKQTEELSDNFKIKYILVSDKFNKEIKIKNDDIFYVSENILNKITQTDTPQGIIAVAEKKIYDIDVVLSKPKDKHFFVVLCNIQDPGNLGTIIRTADAFNSSGVFVSENSADIYSGKTVRASMGSLFHIPVINDVSVPDLLSKVCKYQIKTYALSLKADKFIENIKQEKVMLMFGNESSGIDKEISALADEAVKIRIGGKAESLNVSAAAAIAMYEISK